MKVSLQSSPNRDALFKLSESEPFVMNKMGLLIHRPKSISIYRLKSYRPHMAINYWCGNTHTGNSKFSFLSAPPDGRIVCEACENRAVMAGEKSSDEIVGHHVHVGKLKAVITCCGIKG